MSCEVSSGKEESENDIRDTIQPLSGWWICRIEAAEDTEEERDCEDADLGRTRKSGRGEFLGKIRALAVAERVGGVLASY